MSKRNAKHRARREPIEWKRELAWLRNWWSFQRYYRRNRSNPWWLDPWYRLRELTRK